MKHKGYSHLLCYVFHVLSATDIRENKERVYPQNPHDFRVADTPIPVNINSRSAGRPHVGTDPVSVRLTSVLRTEAILIGRKVRAIAYLSGPGARRVRTDTGSVPTRAAYRPNWHRCRTANHPLASVGWQTYRPELAFYNFIRPTSALAILLMTPLPINEITMIF